MSCARPGLCPQGATPLIRRLRSDRLLCGCLHRGQQVRGPHPHPAARLRHGGRPVLRGSHLVPHPDQAWRHPRVPVRVLLLQLLGPVGPQLHHLPAGWYVCSLWS